ncbi:MAG: hypothetical protein COA42_14440 [Alteromonadaceae bacterium]|nr:MAG: hypothetical protein COA42_14440 [Alteromonadaceae bacterium]
MYKLKKLLLLSLGWTCIALGVLGIVLPLLPTTPFILLASWCFARSSDRFHNWLHNHPKLGPIIAMWQSGEGIPIKVKRRVTLTMVITMSISALIIGKFMPAIVMACIACSVSIYIWRQPTAVIEPKNGKE